MREGTAKAFKWNKQFPISILNDVVFQADFCAPLRIPEDSPGD